MHGNVWEWTNDRHGDYSADPQTDPEGSTTATERIYRGGSWTMTAAYLRSANRYSRVPWYSANNIGFRIAYGYTNKAPTELNSTAPLTIAENQPVGTIVGEFNATDPEGDTLTYHFVSGENNNSLFTLETNGTLKTAATLDYESVSLITIRVRVKDDLNESTEGSFIVSVENVNEPATGTVEIVGTPNIGDILTFSSTITDPDGPPTFEYQWLRDGVPIQNSIINGSGGVDGLDGTDSLCISPDGLHVYA